MNVRKIIKAVRSVPKTVYFNFHYLSFCDALHLPFYISSKVYCKKMKGEVILSVPHLSRGMIRIGFGDTHAGDEKRTGSVWNNSGTVEFQGPVHLGFGSKLYIGEKGRLVFGDRFCITANSEIDCTNRISFGARCLVSWDCLFMDSDEHKIYNLNGNLMNPDKSISIGEDCWIGCRVLCLKGVTVPENSVVAAQSVLTGGYKDANFVYGGNPAKKIKQIQSWER